MAEADAHPTHAPALRHEVAGNMLALYDSGEARLKLLLDEIEGARRSIRMLFYMFLDDECGSQVLDALVRAAGRGVEVRLMVDSFGSSKTPDDTFDPVCDAGGKTIIFNPRLGRRYLIRNHQKLVVVDDRTAIIGGANIGHEYLCDTDEKRWRDLWLRIEGEASPDAAAYFDALWKWMDQPKPRARDVRDLIISHSQREGALQWQMAGPLWRHNPWPGTIARDIIKACKVDIVAAYFSPTRRMLARLGRVAARGGSVRICTAAKSDNNATIAAARHTYSRLLRKAVRLWEYRPAMLHTKLYVTDDVVHVGSANFDTRSLRMNLELMLRIDDAEFARQIRQWIDRELEESQPISSAAHRARANWWRRMKWAFSNWLVTTIDYTVSRRLNFNLSEE
ncbi:phospholipase D-like domain-containing protein [Sphingomicrobium flavum]|uniref:phospholipase D-like domain-containing protein n=1 Tax=Sphingomicrobium flavum TaxID=1229164 RepID=UPI0021ADA3AC|nr:phosphatidylserine/phosphatidylglycerophosphate/cardiolipin synthase family protein [Sphingomicrobium flavum]